MANFSGSLMNSRLLPPEIIWLEPEQIDQAKKLSEHPRGRLSRKLTTEAQQWRRYLNALALLSFEQWIRDRLPAHSIERSAPSIDSVYRVEVNGFKFCLLAVEHVLDEIVQIPQAVVDQPEQAAHFYVLNEVSEEQRLVTLRGILRFDELIDYRDRLQHQSQDGCYSFPLAFMDAEPNHLLFYCRSLQPAAIPLAMSVSAPTDVSPLTTLTNTTTKLTQWLQDRVDRNWQTIDQIINPNAYLAWHTRSMQSDASRGKLINLGVQFGQQTIVLLVNVSSEAEGKVSVLVQLHPTGEALYLSPDIRLSLQSTAGKMLQEVTSRSQDNYIQLKPFKGKPGKRFRVGIHFGGKTVEEDFEL
ncbi:MAG: DUF1822 family protein [Leptolyngbyaceae cyanobacterium MO_188.B28]|nr:DUF1822 family protein [Leptolyngbyaceae cyanobacterium MO_188.B28]